MIRFLAQKIYEQAENKGWPGLGRDVQEICEQINIPNLNTHNMRKSDVQKAISRSHYEDMMSSLRLLENYRISNIVIFQIYNPTLMTEALKMLQPNSKLERKCWKRCLEIFKICIKT